MTSAHSYNYKVANEWNARTHRTYTYSIYLRSRAYTRVCESRNDIGTREDEEEGLVLLGNSTPHPPPVGSSVCAALRNQISTSSYDRLHVKTYRVYDEFALCSSAVCGGENGHHKYYIIFLHLQRPSTTKTYTHTFTIESVCPHHPINERSHVTHYANKCHTKYGRTQTKWYSTKRAHC